MIDEQEFGKRKWFSTVRQKWQLKELCVSLAHDHWLIVVCHSNFGDMLCGDSLLVERLLLVASSNSSRSGRRIFFSRINFVCWLLIGVHFTPVLPQWHVRDPGHSAKSACGRLHLNMHTPLTHRSQSGLTMLLSWQSVGFCQKISSHTTHQEHFVTVVSARRATVDCSWPKEWNWCVLAHLNYKKKKKKSADGEWIVKHSPQILARKENATTTTIDNISAV